MGWDGMQYDGTYGVGAASVARIQAFLRAGAVARIHATSKGIIAIFRIGREVKAKLELSTARSSIPASGSTALNPCLDCSGHRAFPNPPSDTSPRRMGGGY